MGFLSSLFGFGGGGSSTPATTTNVVSQKLPSEIAPYITTILAEGQEAFDAEKEAGYQPYTGETSAGLTAEQEQALTGLAGMVGTQQPFIDESGEIIRQGADQFTGDVAQKYMSPYQQAVTDIELREAQNKFDTQIMPSFEAKAVGAGGMSGLGTRAGVQAAELQRGQSQLLSDIQAKGLQKSYDAGIKEYGQQKARENQMAGQIAALGGKEVAANLTELGALKSAGEERQLLNQGALDEAYFKFLEEKQFPKQNLAEFSGLVYGNPLSSMRDVSTTGTKSAYQPSTGQSLLGMGLGAANIYGMGGGFGGDFSGATLGKTLFGIPKKEGGNIGEGLSGLPVVRRGAGGQSFPGPNYNSGYGFDTRPDYEKISDELMDPNTSTERRNQLTGELTSGRMSFTGPSQAATKERNIKRERVLSGINTTADKARGKANEAGLTALKRAVNIGDTARKDNLKNTLDDKRANLIQNMKNKGASRKEIQAALDAMPKRGPGLSTKTGSPSGFGQDVVNILETLRTDVNKQKALDDTQKRTDIYNMGKMKRTDQAVEAAGQSDITTTKSAGKQSNINRQQQGAELIGKTEAANIISKLTNEQASRLKDFTLEQKGIDKVENLPKEALAEFIKLEELRIKKEAEKTKGITARTASKPLDKSAVPFLSNIKKNIAIGLNFIYNDATGEVTSNGTPIKGDDAKKYQDLVSQAENVFTSAMDGKSTSNKNYMAANKIVNTFLMKNQSKASVPSVSQRKAGQVYPTPKGNMKWTGTGWVQP